MKVVIRVDASVKIGIGHVMRCLTLADAFNKNNVQVEFICREHEGNLIDFIQMKGFKVYSLLMKQHAIDAIQASRLKSKNNLTYNNWLGVSQQQDADLCKVILKKINPDWVVVDHYALDEIWQISLQDTYKKIMVIDDLADRKHQCDLLLDQTYDRQTKHYKYLVPDSCQLLLGSKYSLLRPEFAMWREYSLNRRENPELKKLLISLGGVDENNVTGKILGMLKTCNLHEDLEIMVIVGSICPHLDEIKQQSDALPYNIVVKSDINNMAEIMANSDFAFGASGTTTWERCCLGLPSIQIILAENQRFIAKSIQKSRAALCIEVNQLDQMNFHVNILMNQMKNLINNSAKVTDGIGVNKVLRHIQ
jgi:UDP-2,4-diacetamido-2,4,6-trideoxy-beta-L-altropyranose hydrolase